MIKELILAIIPVVIGCLITYQLDKKTDKHKAIKKSEHSKKSIGLLDVTHWIRINDFKLMTLMMAWSVLYVFYVASRKILHIPLPDISNIVAPATYALVGILFMSCLIDLLFYPYPKNKK